MDLSDTGSVVNKETQASYKIPVKVIKKKKKKLKKSPIEIQKLDKSCIHTF